MMERRFRRSVKALEEIFDFVTEFAASERVPVERRYDVDLILEELFTNMVKYGGPAGEDIAIGLERQGDSLSIVLRDFGVDEFDITAARPRRNGTPDGEPMPGGRGLDLVRQYADDIRYDFRDRITTITVTKRLDS
jgi:anti-sigma regulatory factor (Ser/Thr protein kinase)